MLFAFWSIWRGGKVLLTSEINWPLVTSEWQRFMCRSSLVFFKASNRHKWHFKCIFVAFPKETLPDFSDLIPFSNPLFKVELDLPVSEIPSLKVAFIRKVLMCLSYLQTDGPNYFPELKFCHFKWFNFCHIRLHFAFWAFRRGISCSFFFSLSFSCTQVVIKKS